MKTPIRALMFLAAVTVAAPAAAETFEVAAATSNVSFTSDALLETITGTTTGISGTIETDLSNPSATTATIQVDVASMNTGVPMRDEHLHGADWLDAATHPNITFAIDGVTVPDGTTLAHGVSVDAMVSGTLTIKGTTQDVSVPATVTYYVIDNPEVAGTYGIDNNVLRVESAFDVTLADYGISIMAPLRTKVAETINLRIRLTAVQQAEG